MRGGVFLILVAYTWVGLAAGGVSGALANPSRMYQLASGICPQPRKTQDAPEHYRKLQNPLPDKPVHIDAGKALYYQNAKPTACKLCHGVRGNGNGRLAIGLKPAPRNFTCEGTMKEVTDGQMFWIIKNGSKGTAMPAHESTLSDRQIWQLIRFVRGFSK